MKEINKVDLTVIVPVHSVKDENFKMYLDSALKSINANTIKPEKVLIVRCPCIEVKTELNEFDFSGYDLNIEVVENNTGKSLQNQINYGVSITTTKYFEFLEFDDEVSVSWLKNVDTYSKLYPDVKMFLPIISDITDAGGFIGYTNEAAWANGFSERLGFLDLETLLEFPNINLSGMVVDVEAFKAIGGYKPSIKLTFNYELLLRALSNSKTVMVIPKIGYLHRNMRPGSLFWDYKNGETKLTSEEAQFWMEIAKKEFYFIEDRNISYAQKII